VFAFTSVSGQTVTRQKLEANVELISGVNRLANRLWQCAAVERLIPVS